MSYEELISSGKYEVDQNGHAKISDKMIENVKLTIDALDEYTNGDEDILDMKKDVISSVVSFDERLNAFNTSDFEHLVSEDNKDALKYAEKVELVFADDFVFYDDEISFYENCIVTANRLEFFLSAYELGLRGDDFSKLREVADNASKNFSNVQRYLYKENPVDSIAGWIYWKDDILFGTTKGESRAREIEAVFDGIKSDKDAQLEISG